ncbi:MAG: carboxypeptidase regulatory-like domain-containing protein, partial [Armatimonadota bacterium]
MRMLRFAIVICLVLSSVVASAYTWDAVANFSGTSNPNGIWSYGYVQDGVFNLDQYTQSWDTYLGTGRAVNWGPSPSPDYPIGYPVILHNTTGVDFLVWDVVLAPADRLYMNSNPNRLNIVKFTVPVTGNYTVNASFKKCEAPAKAGMAVYSSSYSIGWTATSDAMAFGEVVSMPAASSTLNAGDTISFEVNSGSDNSPASDSVALAATIDLDLAGQGIVSGIVKNDATTPWPGKVIPSASVEVIGGSSMTTADDGVYYFQLAPGTYTLRASKAGYTTKDISVTVTADGVVSQDIEMALADASITGV